MRVPSTSAIWRNWLGRLNHDYQCKSRCHGRAEPCPAAPTGADILVGRLASFAEPAPQLLPMAIEVGVKRA